MRVVLLLACLVVGCTKRPEGQRAYYFWRTTFTLTPPERERLKSNHVSRLYLRLFDVAWSRETSRAEPVGLTAFTEPVPAGLGVVPVVYVRNEVFTHAETNPEALADQLAMLVRARSATGAFTFRELQVDCDWTDSTREAFFAFCRRLRSELEHEQVTLTATIRLHQVKYPERTGVPPVERGMLMFYNMGRLAPDTERPSIFNAEDAEKYTARLDAYPLPLDAALPVFSWVVQSRAGRVIDLLAKPDLEALAANPALKKQSDLRYVATEGSFVAGGYVQPGDALVVDAMTPSTSRDAAQLLARHFHPRGPFTISLFELDERNLHAYAPDDVDALFSAVR